MQKGTFSTFLLVSVCSTYSLQSSGEGYTGVPWLISSLTPSPSPHPSSDPLTDFYPSWYHLSFCVITSALIGVTGSLWWHIFSPPVPLSSSPSPLFPWTPSLLHEVHPLVLFYTFFISLFVLCLTQMRGAIQCLSLCVWCISLKTVFSRRIHFLTNISNVWCFSVFLYL